MSNSNSLTVSDVRQETKDAISICFQVPENLRSEYAFRQGQYLSILRKFNGEELKRSYSICSAIQDNELRIAVKKVEDGRFSSFAHEALAVGDELNVAVPAGRFHTELDPEATRHYAAFAAGSGITPVISTIKTILQAEPLSQFTLFYGNKTANDVIFLGALEDLKNMFMTRFRLFHIFSRQEMDAPLLNGRIDSEKTQALCDAFLDVSAIDAFFLCGPGTMVRDTRQALMDQGVNARSIKIELFGQSKEAQAAYEERRKKLAAGNPGDTQVTIVNGGRRLSFPLGRDGTSVLDGAMVAGADLPFACKGGVCCTCKAKLTSGEVEMAVNYGLDQDEIDAGFILTCQAQPTTDQITVDFDQK